MAAKGSLERGAQIDLLFDREDGAITLCEMKYSTAPFTLDKEQAQNLLNKKDVFIKETKTTKQVFIAIITANGIKNNFYVEEMISGIVIMSHLFES